MATTTTTLPRRTAPASSRNEAAPWYHLDLTLYGTVVAIAGLGVLMVYSATFRKLADSGGDPHLYLKKQALFTIAGIAVMVLMSVVDYRVYRDFAPMIYIGTCLLLVAVLSPLGSNSKGTQAWFQMGSFQLQPSEWAKVALVVCLAAYTSAHRGRLDGRRLLGILVLAGVPMGLIELQPDLGTDLVFAAILLATVLVAGARPRHIGLMMTAAAVLVFLVFHFGVLKQYQQDRLKAFLDPAGDAQRTTWNLQQAKTAIANGGLTGKGLYKGTQTNLSYVPEQHTDFVFTVVGEELGLVGSAVLLALFALLVWRTWRAAALAKDLCGTLVCVGVLAMLVLQIFENVGMTMGIMPITGIPLPFMSYGGSATIASFAAIGLVQNVHMRRFT